MVLCRFVLTCPHKQGGRHTNPWPERPKNPKSASVLRFPESLVARLEPGNKSISSRAVELIEAGLSGGERIVIKMPLVYCPQTMQSGAPRPKPIPAAAPTSKTSEKQQSPHKEITSSCRTSCRHRLGSRLWAWARKSDQFERIQRRSLHRQVKKIGMRQAAAALNFYSISLYTPISNWIISSTAAFCLIGSLKVVMGCYLVQHAGSVHQEASMLGFDGVVCFWI